MDHPVLLVYNLIVEGLFAPMTARNAGFAPERGGSPVNERFGSFLYSNDHCRAHGDGRSNVRPVLRQFFARTILSFTALPLFW